MRAWAETCPGLLPDAVIARRTVAVRRALWSAVLAGNEDDAVFLGARGDEAPSGFVACGPQRDGPLAEAGFAGESGALYVLRRAQGAGLGRALMRAAAAHLRARGRRGVALWVLGTNLPARGFYARLGGAPAGTRDNVLDDHVAHDVAFGWPDGGIIGN